MGSLLWLIEGTQTYKALGEGTNITSTYLYEAFIFFLVCSICEEISPSSTSKKFAHHCFRQELAKASWLYGRGENINLIFVWVKEGRWLNFPGKVKGYGIPL